MSHARPSKLKELHKKIQEKKSTNMALVNCEESSASQNGSFIEKEDHGFSKHSDTKQSPFTKPSYSIAASTQIRQPTKSHRPSNTIKNGPLQGTQYFGTTEVYAAITEITTATEYVLIQYSNNQSHMVTTVQDMEAILMLSDCGTEITLFSQNILCTEAVVKEMRKNVNYSNKLEKLTIIGIITVSAFARLMYVADHLMDMDITNMQLAHEFFTIRQLINLIPDYFYEIAFDSTKLTGRRNFEDDLFWIQYIRDDYRRHVDSIIMYTSGTCESETFRYVYQRIEKSLKCMKATTIISDGYITKEMATTLTADFSFKFTKTMTSNYYGKNQTFCVFSNSGYRHDQQYTISFAFQCKQ